ncbi:MAG: hypothetical protein CMK03_04970 [Ponticaulis sp.]|nr:hypothetical protein [Ponticaulis sp.]
MHKKIAEKGVGWMRMGGGYVCIPSGTARTCMFDLRISCGSKLLQYPIHLPMSLVIRVSHAFTGVPLWTGSCDQWLPCDYILAQIARTTPCDIGGVSCVLQSGVIMKPNIPLWNYALNNLLELSAVFRDGISEMAEHVEALPLAITKHDPFLYASVMNGDVQGFVTCVVTGSISQTRLYEVLYDDGDAEHFDTCGLIGAASCMRPRSGPVLFLDRNGIAHSKLLRHCFMRRIWALPAGAANRPHQVLNARRLYVTRKARGKRKS